MFFILLLHVFVVSLFSRTTSRPTVRPSIYKDIRPGQDEEFKKTYKGTSGFSLLGKDINKFFLKKKKTGERKSHWYYQTFPVLYPSTDTGFNYGARLMLYQLSQKPYKYHFLFQYWGSDRGRAKHEMKFVAPNLFDRIYFRLKLQYTNRISARYFGLGQSINNQEYTDWRSSNYLSRVYYWYKIKKPSLNLFTGLKLFRKKIMLYTDLFFTSVSIDTYYQNNQSYVFVNKPYGFDGGLFNYLKFGILYDTKSQPVNPSYGLLFDFAYTRFAIFSGDYEFNSLAFSFAYFKAIPRYFTLASRLIGSYFWGPNIPFFAYNAFYLNNDIDGLGGGNTLRGFTSDRFIDNLKTVLQLELRTRFYESMIGRKLVEVDLVPFVDFGVVSHSFSDYSLKNLEYSTGISFRTIFNTRSMVKITFARSRENFAVFFGFGENFK